MNSHEIEAKAALDKIITKSRVHLYKPIQIAEILYRDRIHGDIRLDDLTTYRTKSKQWRDEICSRLVGRSSTSSARFQDNLFEENAIPPRLISKLGDINKKGNGIVEVYIYNKFKQRFSQMSKALEYCSNTNLSDFDLSIFLELFWHEPGLRRSIDKIYEIVVYSLFSTLVDVLDITIKVDLNSKDYDLLREFEDFTEKVINLTRENSSITIPAKIFRVGVTNAADRGLDMWANFGLAIQIKHLSLNEELAENIVTTVSADRIVIVCKDTEKNVIVSLLTQIGWKSRIQSIITECDLINWYKKALKGKYAPLMGQKIIKNLLDQIELEFPSSDDSNLIELYKIRNYLEISDDYWK